jgi:Tol biopolymer transport system component/ketosteroid isomerase-like protein
MWPVTPQPKRGFVAVVAVIVLLALAGYGRLLRPGRVPYSIHSDLVSMHLGTKAVLYESLRRGDGIPFWRDDQLSGVPAYTNPESQYTYPLHALFWLLPPAAAAGPTIWLQLVVGAFVLYWVGVTLGLGRAACLFMAVAGLFNFKLIAITYAGFLPVLSIATLFPLLFAALFRVMREPDLKRTLVLGAAAALCLDTGGFQLLYDAALLMGGYLAWRAFGWWRESRRGDAEGRGHAGRREHASRVLLAVLVAAVLALGVSAHRLVPMLAEARLLSRSETSYEFFVSGYSLTLRHMLNFLYPGSIGRLTDATQAGRYLWEDVTYFGIVPLALAVVGAVRGRRREHTPFLVAGFAVSLLLAAETPLTRLMHAALPGFGLFRMPIRFVHLAGFFGIALAGVGLEETLALLRARLGLEEIASGARVPGAVPGRGARAAIARLLPVALVAVVAVEGAFYAHRYIRTKPTAFVLPQPDYAARLASDATLFRVAPTTRHTIQPGWAAPLHLQTVTGYLPYNLDDYGAFLELLQSGRIEHTGVYSWADPVHVRRRDLLDVLNVKYVVSPIPLDHVADNGFSEEARAPDQPLFAFFAGMVRSDLYLYRNNRLLDRAFWADEVVSAPDRDGVIAAIRGNDLRATAVVYGGDPPWRAPAPASGAETKVAVTSSSPGRLALVTTSGARRFLVISEVWHPGWQATLDGEPLPLVACDLTLMGAWIPPGEHRVALRFRPLHWPLALGITGAFIALWLAAIGACVRGSGARRMTAAALLAITAGTGVARADSGLAGASSPAQAAAPRESAAPAEATAPYDSAWPHWSPDGRSLVFSSTREEGDWEIHTMRADGTGALRLTRSPGRDAHPYYTPDGGRILFQSPRDSGVEGEVDLYSMNLGGGDVQRLVTGPGFDGVPVPSPDGAWIAYMHGTRAGEGWHWEIRRIDVRGQRERALTRGAWNSQVPTWSPDGRRLAIYADHEGRDQLFLLDLRSGKTTPLAPSGGADRTPAFSPDGRFVAFVSTRDGGPDGPRDLYMVEVASGTVTRLTTGFDVWSQPAWSPDGRRIALSAKRQGVDEIFVLDLDGGAPVRLTRGAEGWRSDDPRFEVEAALQEYARLTRAMDADRLAAAYETDGALINPGMDPVVGREAIRKFLGSFTGVRVVANSMSSSATERFGDAAFIWGDYAESVVIGDQPGKDFRGRFVAEWRRQPDGRWLLRRLLTQPSAP